MGVKARHGRRRAVPTSGWEAAVARSAPSGYPGAPGSSMPASGGRGLPGGGMGNQPANPSAAGSTGDSAIVFNIDAEKLPKSADLKSYLFPSTLTISVSDQDVRIVSRGPFPDFSALISRESMAALVPALQSIFDASKLGGPSPAGVAPGASAGADAKPAAPARSRGKPARRRSAVDFRPRRPGRWAPKRWSRTQAQVISGCLLSTNEEKRLFLSHIVQLASLGATEPLPVLSQTSTRPEPSPGLGRPASVKVEDPSMEFVHEVTAYLENKPGRLAKICSALAQEKIDIRALSVMESEGPSVLRLITTELESTKNVLTSLGTKFRMSEVLAVQLENRTGALARVLEKLAEEHINVEYAYASTAPAPGKALGIFHTSNQKRASQILNDAASSAPGSSRSTGRRPLHSR